LTTFRCPLTIITNQGIHFINDTIKHLTKQFLLKHVSCTTYYPQGNGQAESTIKVIGRLTKLEWKKKRLGQTFFYNFVSYRIVYKVVIGYTPYQLVYGLHPLTPIEYVLPAISGDP
jgi:hypothetical protein